MLRCVVEALLVIQKIHHILVSQFYKSVMYSPCQYMHYIYTYIYIYMSTTYIYHIYIYIRIHINIHMHDRHQQPQRLRGASGLLMLGDGSQVGSTRNSNRLRSTSSGQRYSFRVKSWLLLRSLSNTSAVQKARFVS